METNPHIDRLIEMLDHPEAYSEQEIQDIINRDHETREAYRLFTTSKMAKRYKQKAETLDVNAAWQRFEQKHYSQQSRRWLKMAASFAGIILFSGIVFAAILMVQKPSKTTPYTATTTIADTISTDSIVADKSAVLPIVYDNVSLESILQEVVAYYAIEHSETLMTVVYRNDAARHLRFHFVWNREQGIEKVVDDLNHFERLHVTLNDYQLIVE